MARRAKVARVWFSAGLLVLGGHLAWVQLVSGPALAATGRAERTRTVVLPAARGEILARNGEVLALSVPVATVTADPPLVTHPRAEASRLATVLGVPAPPLLRALRAPGQYAVVQRDVTAAQARAIAHLALPGVYTHRSSVRRYPAGFFMGSILGFTNAAGGVAGVEQTYQQALAGRNGYRIEQVDPLGQRIPFTHAATVPARPGLNLRLTILPGLQADLQSQLEAAIATTGATRAYAIVLRPATGSILAAGAWPTYDPNAPGDVNPSVWNNTVASYDMPPGSVFKPFTASVGLLTGVVTPTTPFYDPGVLLADGVPLHNWMPLPHHTNFLAAFEESANVVFGKVGLRIGAQRFYQYLHAFGLFNLPGGDMPDQQPNIIAPLSQANALTVASESFGESLTVTPLSLITMLNVVADGGLLIQPHVGSALLGSHGQVVRRIRPVVVRRVIPAQVAASVRRMMVDVARYGTGERGLIPCYDVAAKTGTSNIYGPHGVTNQFIASFTEMAPASQPQALVLVQLYDPRPPFNDGGEVAAPVAQYLLANALHLLGVPPHCTSGDRAAPLPGGSGTTLLTLQMVDMPAIENLPPQVAAARVRALGIYLHVHGKGSRILRQDPPAGAQVQKWTTVQGYTQPGSLVPASFVVVPGVQGLSVSSAAARLAAVGLAMDASGVGTVAAQVPGAGTRVPPGSAVAVRLG